MRRMIYPALLALVLAAGCSGEQSTGLDNANDESSSTDTDGKDETDPPPTKPQGPKAARAPRLVSLDAAGGTAKSENFQMRFRVAAPIVVAGAREATGPKARRNP